MAVVCQLRCVRCMVTAQRLAVATTTKLNIPNRRATLNHDTNIEGCSGAGFDDACGVNFSR